MFKIINKLFAKINFGDFIKTSHVYKMPFNLKKVLQNTQHPFTHTQTCRAATKDADQEQRGIQWLLLEEDFEDTDSF